MGKKSAFEEDVRVKAPGDDGFEYDLNDQKHRDEIRAFEQELSKFMGPYRFELYCVAKEYFTKPKQIRRGNINGMEFEQPMYYAINGAKIHEFVNASQKLTALKKLLNRRSFAKEEEKKQLDTMAEQVKIEPVPEEDDLPF